MRVLVFGDSITQGYWDTDGGWVVESEIVARTRHNNLPTVLIQIGINDSSADMSSGLSSVSLPLEQYEQNLDAIIKKVRPLCSKMIFVGLPACDESRTTPVSWGDFYYTNRAIKTYENTMRDIAAMKELAPLLVD